MKMIQISIYLSPYVRAQLNINWPKVKEKQNKRINRNAEKKCDLDNRIIG